MGYRRIDPVVMEKFWVLLASGLTGAEAAAAAGCSAEGARSAFVSSGGIRPRSRPAPSGRFLSFREREEIAIGWAQGLTAADIARRLGRHRSTITRELLRNQIHRGQPRDLRRPGERRRDGAGRVRYRASTAHWHAHRRARRPKAARLATNIELRQRVEHWLDKKLSPRQIGNKLRREYPDRPEMWVSHETIYQALYVQSRGALRRELTTCLRTGRAIRRPQRRPDERRGRLRNMLLISDRPAEVDDRAVPGHWEGDLIIGKNLDSAIGTLVERSTRFVMLLHLPDGRRPEQVQAAMLAQMSRLPEHLRRSLTWDRGKEMARHVEISTALDMPIYFCDPHSPWQRGSNENTNGLLRQYFPKGTDLSVHSAAHLDFVAAELNERPRQTLAWDSPAERLNQLLLQ
jgi:transposase, IS30 family